MGTTTADLLVERLMHRGVDTVFGLPGDGINGIMEALRKQRERIRFVHVRHEESAALAACGYAKFTGRLGVCLATSGPGAIHLLNGLYDAKLDCAPVLAITGMTYHDLIGTRYQQDIDTDRLFADVAAFSQRVMGPAHVAAIVDGAVRTAVGQRTVGHIAVPVDLQDADAASDEPSRKNVPGHSSGRYQVPSVVPTSEDLDRAAGVLRGRTRPVILAGAGARGAAAELEAAAERLGAPVVKALLGKDVLPDDSPYATGGIGLLGTLPSVEAMEQADALLIVGSSFPYLEYYPKPGQAAAVQIDLDPTRLGLRYPIEAGLVGDARATLRELVPRLPRNDDRSFLDSCQRSTGEWWRLMEERARGDERPMKPQVVPSRLSDLLAEDAIVATDTGTVTVWAARHLRIRPRQRFSVSGSLASMACAVPYAIGAQVAFPGRQVVAIAGDGGFQMLMAEFATCVQERLPIKVIVLRNDTLGMIKWEQMVFLGNPEYGVGLSPVDLVAFAEACGARGFRIEDPSACRDTLADAFATDGPVLVEAVVDPFEPPQPPRIGPEQALNMARALARGEPNPDRIALTLFRNAIGEAAFPASPTGLPAKVGAKVAELVGADRRDGDGEDEGGR